MRDGEVVLCRLIADRLAFNEGCTVRSQEDDSSSVVQVSRHTTQSKQIQFSRLVRKTLDLASCIGEKNGGKKKK